MAAGEGGDGRCSTEWRGTAHAIAQVTGVRGSDGRNSDARATVTPIDCLRVGAGTSLEGDVGGEREQESKERLVATAVVAARGRCRDDGNRRRRYQRAGRQKSPKIQGVRRGDSGDREGAREGREKTEVMAENEWARAQRHRARERITRQAREFNMLKK
ncbi:hypothetical protein BGW80DRAFT_1254365 [Lactifluus volemus]|nr:hypothetical protein BGW80DRAFT_1254365 [Lactifluus volemus]